MSKQQFFDITLRTDAYGMSVLIPVAEGTAEVVSVTPVTEAPKVAMKKRENATHFYRDGKRNKGIRCAELVLARLNVASMQTLSDHELSEALIASGFAPGSLSPTLSQLRMADKIHQVTKGKWRLGGEPRPALAAV